MSFLSLAKGDPAARKLVAQAIQVRYGVRPLPISSLHLEMTTPTRGWLGLPATQTVTIRGVGTTHFRYDSWQTQWGIKTRQFTESYDGGAVYIRKVSTLTTHNDAPTIRMMGSRLWVWLSLLLTPLTEEEITLKSIDATVVRATPEEMPGVVSTVTFNAATMLESVMATWPDAVTGADVSLTLRPVGALKVFNEFSIPEKLGYQLSGAPEQILTVVRAEANPKIPLTEFTLSGH